MKVSFKNPKTEMALRTWELNPSQERFWLEKKKYVLFSGGFGCGKSLMLVLKAIELSLKYPGNFILMGRKTYVELRDSLWKEFIAICPPEFLDGEPRRGEMKIVFKNKSEIIFRHLDTIAETELRSLNLGAAFIDQAEDISKEVFLALQGRLRREGVPNNDRKIYLSCNPKLSWLFADFKQEPLVEAALIEASTLENRANLPEGYIESLLQYPESWRRQFVEGVWDYSLLAERVVFSREYVARLLEMQRDPLRMREEVEIFEEFIPGHKYQMGIDAAEGFAGDEAAITVACLTCLQEAASWSGRLPPDVVAEKGIRVAKWYQDEYSRCLIVPEMNSIGMALVNKLKQESGEIRIYQREEFDKMTGQKIDKYGWRTTSATKPLLVSRFQERLRLQNPCVYSARTLEQFKSFVHTDAAKSKGMAAETGFHDDRVIACLLAFWEKAPIKPGQFVRPVAKSEPDKLGKFMVVNGKLKYKPQFRPELMIERGRSWKVG